MIRQSAILTIIFILSAGCASQRAATLSTPLTHRDRVYFEFDRARIRPSEREKLGKVADQLKTDRKSVAVLEGHADRIGSARYNEILAEKRARAVRAYLWTLGADPARMPMISKGEREPAAKGHTRKDHQENRRVEVILTTNSKPDRRKP